MQETNQRSLISIILSSSLGTLIEWYDFYIFGSLAVIIAQKFFPTGNPTAALLSTLATFAAGFIVRPFGALFFGRLGDIVGRKYTFLVTLSVMGLSTFLIGCIPSFETIGWAAPIMVLFLRLLQGLAVGGEYGGATTYVAEHAPKNARGFWTSWIQVTAPLGLLVTLAVIISVKSLVGDVRFNDWGWRIPFWVSILLVGVSIAIRLRMAESPLFAKIKSQGKTSTNPLKESFGKRENFKMVLIALFGATMGQGTVGYTVLFYPQLFLINICHIESNQVNIWICYALLITGFGNVLTGWLSDYTSRKIIMMMGMALAVLFTKPIYESIFQSASVSAKTEIVEKRTSKETRTLATNKTDSVSTAETIKYYTDGTQFTQKTETILFADASHAPKDYRPKATQVAMLPSSLKWTVIGPLMLLGLFSLMIYGPLAAYLVELFPTRIRYTSLSLPYHIGSGVLGGMVPFVSTLLYEYSKTPDRPEGDPFSGLVYPVSATLVCLIIGTFYLPNKGNEMDNE